MAIYLISGNGLTSVTMATIMKWKIDPTIGMIGPKIKALALTVEDFMAIYLFSGNGRHRSLWQP